MSSGTGPIHWVAPEFFTGHYTEKADVFSLGTLFFAILERDFIELDGKRFYGAFVKLDPEGKVGLGYAMSRNPNVKVTFSLHTQVTTSQRRVTLDALLYNANERPSAGEIYERVQSARESVKLQANTTQQTSGSCC